MVTELWMVDKERGGVFTFECRVDINSTEIQHIVLF